MLRPLLWISTTCAGVLLVLFAAWSVLVGPAPEDGPSRLLADTPADEITRQFDNETNVITVGYPAMLVPAAHMAEVMRRDRILKRDAQRVHTTVRMIPFQDHRLLVAGFNKGMDGAVIGGVYFLRVAAQHNSRIVSRVLNAHFTLICRSARTVADLNGRRIGFVAGSTSHYMTERTLSRAGVRLSDVQMLALSQPDPVPALISGEIDACGAAEPVPTLALRNFPELTAVGHESLNMYLVFSQRAIEQHREIIRRIVASQIRAIYWLKTSEKNLHLASSWVRDTQRPLLAPQVLMDLSDYTRIATEFVLDAKASVDELSTPRLTRSELEDQFNFARQNGLIPRDSSWDRLSAQVEADMVRDVLSRPDDYSVRSSDLSMEPL